MKGGVVRMKDALQAMHTNGTNEIKNRHEKVYIIKKKNFNRKEKAKVMN